MVNKKNQKRKVKVKPIPIMILCGIIIVIIALIIWAVVSNAPKEDKQVNIDISTIEKSRESVEEKVTVATKVTIDIDDSAVPLGTTFMVTATIEPIDTADAVRWVTSDENILTVDKEGVVTIKGIGTAALTATVGNVSDAVVIEGIENSGSKSQNNLPVYTLGSGNTGSADNVGSNNTGDNDNSAGGSDANTSAGENENTDNGGSGGDNGQDASGDNGNSSTGNENGGNDSSTGGTDNGGMNSNDLYGVLENIGYSQMYTNVYIYQDADTYYGEIIIQPNLTIIYIKSRNSEYDTKIKSVIEGLLPGKADQVWNNYLSAGSDRTFEIDDRMVRIVTALKGGHSQIVIYN